ncbi:MAG: endolytic transglycosylase MltG [Oscillospiraceae bacterium]|nr:endolytic transglycosylase MltG [Oscillospiraceae bacterium]MDD4414437.1 endolytic transglycosylase MltG [Oscillospiraceae bacterium]
MSDDLDKILNDTEAEKQAKLIEDETTRRSLHIDEITAQRLAEERRNKVSGFKLNIDLESADDNLPADSERTGGEPAPTQDGNHTVDSQKSVGDNSSDTSEQPVMIDDTKEETGKGKKNASRSSFGCIRGIIYGVLVLAVSGLFAYFGVVGGLDLTGLFKSDTKVPVTLTAEQVKDVDEVARVLKEAGVIDQPMIFSLFCKLTGSDEGLLPQDEASISPDMGYKAIINILKTAKREIVRVTFPEGMTIKEIAEKLEKNKVCSASDFYIAMKKDNLNHDFLKEIPTGDKYKGRFEWLEGYVFPDSYDFYVGSSGETALKKFLGAFNNRINTTMRAKIKSKGMELNDTIILASIIQWEAAKLDDMYRVSRVLHNRLNIPERFPRLECDSTLRYIDSIVPLVNGKRVKNTDYNTYIRSGLPVGAINNPGLDAIDAAINPSDENYYKDCYYFATDLKTGETKFSKTLAEHERWCRSRGIGLYG